MATRKSESGAGRKRGSSRTDFADAFKEALEAGRRRDYPLAVELLERIAAETDELPRTQLYLGRALQASGRLGPAIASLARYASSSPEDAAGWFFLGRALLQAGRKRPAASCLKRSLRRDGSNPESWALYGYALLGLKRAGAAVRALEKAVSLAPDDERILRGYLNALFIRAVRLLARGDADMARQMLSFVIEKGLDGIPQRLYRARAFRELGNIDAALADCDAALEQAPDDLGILVRRAELLLAAGRSREAMEALAELKAVRPDMPELQWDEDALASWRAFTLLQSGDARGALAAALDNIRADPEDAQARAVAAEAYRALGQKERAIAHYERAVALDPKSPELRLGLAAALFQAGEIERAGKSAERAARDGGDASIAAYYSTLCASRAGADPVALVPRLHELLRAWPADPDLMFALGEALFRQGRPDLALGWFSKVTQARKDDELGQLYLISCAESSSDQAAADAAYEAYLERWPDNAKIRRDLVERLAGRGDWNRAAAVLESGQAYGDQGLSAKRVLARAYREIGRYNRAAVLYRELLRHTPKDAELLLSLAWCLNKSGASEFAIALLEKGAPVLGKEGPWLALGRLRARKRDIEGAAKAMGMAASIAPLDPLPRRDLSRLYAKAGLQEFAERYAREAQDLEKARRPSRRNTRSSA